MKSSSRRKPLWVSCKEGLSLELWEMGGVSGNELPGRRGVWRLVGSDLEFHGKNSSTHQEGGCHGLHGLL